MTDAADNAHVELSHSTSEVLPAANKTDVPGFPFWDSLPERFLISDYDAYLAYFKAFVGVSIVFLPYAVKSGGLAASIATFVLVTYLATTCILKMGESKDRLVEDFRRGITHNIAHIHQVVGFEMLAEAVWGKTGRNLLEGSITISQVCFPTLYLIFISQNIHNIVWQYGNCDEAYNWNSIVYIWIIIPFLIPPIFVRHLSKFSVAILIADALIIAGLLFLYFRFTQMMYQQGGVGPGIVQFDPVGYSTLLGTAFFALEGSPFVLPIQHAMARKDHFARVTIWSGVMVGTIYLSFGVVGYLAFGSSVGAAITLSLKLRDPLEWSSTAVQIAFCIALLFAFPVDLFPVSRVLESKLLDIDSFDDQLQELESESAVTNTDNPLVPENEQSSSSTVKVSPDVDGNVKLSPNDGNTAVEVNDPDDDGEDDNNVSNTKVSLWLAEFFPNISSRNMAFLMFMPHRLIHHVQTKEWQQNALRFALIVFCASVASACGAMFDNVVSLVGGIMCVPLTLIYPAYFYLRICGDRASTRELIEVWLCLIVGTLSTVACTVASIWEWAHGVGSDSAHTCIKM